MNSVYASLCMLGHKNSGYIDDSLMGDTYLECEENIHTNPPQKISFFFNWIDSEKNDSNITN